MRLLNHIYPRLLLFFLSLIVTNLAMGQGKNEAVVPIKNIAVWEQHKVDDHPLTNLYDGDKNTTWSSYRDGFPVLEYMHIKNPDPNGNGQRHWVELPYTPNNNTEIEITFKAKTTSGGLKQNILGFGYPPFGNGMSLNINGDGNIVYGTSNHIHTLAAKADNQKHTIICSATSVTIDGGANLMPGTIDPNNSEPDVIQDGFTSQHNLCIFSNPAEDQQWARCFDGDIYSVKIRESGKLLYDLVPTKGWWGRPGFYDRISTEIFTFFDMVDYVSNTDVTDGAPLHIHYKIPYKMGSGTTARTQWTSNLVTNGDFASDDTTSFTFVKDIFVPRIASDVNGKYIQVYNNGTHPEGNVWDCHLRVDLTEELVADETYTLSFYAKASKNAVATFDFSNAAGDYHSGSDRITSDVKNVPFTTNWVQHTYTIEGKDVTDKGLIKGIGLNLNNEKSAVLYSVRDFVLTKQSEDKNLVHDHKNYTDLTNYPINDAIDKTWTSRIITVDGKRCAQVVNNATGANSWDCQLRVNLSETLSEGDQYNISFNIKAKQAADISGQLQIAGGGYYGGLPVKSVGTTWKHVEWTGTVGANGSNVVGAIGLLLNETKTANTYYITDVVVKKGTPSSDMVPDTEVEITYKNTRGDTDYTSTRYLFSYDTKEKNVLALGIRENKYWYTTGGVTTDFGDVPNIKNETITTTFRPTEFIRGSVYNVTSATTWNTAVSNFYLFGTHSTSDQYARSFIGEIYGAVIREGNEVKVDLQPAWKNGVYGFYDRRTNTFYTKDEDDDNNCGKGANFRGVTAHDAQAPVDHSEGILTAYTIYPNNITIDLASPKVVKNFYMKTAADKIGDYTNNSPARWTLYGSSGDDKWTELYKYEQTVPKFSALNAGTTPEPSGTAYKSASELESATTYYLYNVETGRFLMSEGHRASPDWGTRAYIQPNNAWKVKVTLKDGKYTIYDCNLTINKDGYQWWEFYVFNNGNVWTDYNNQQTNDFSRDWNITSIGNNLYEISSPDLIPSAKLGTSVSSNIDSDKRLYLSTEAKNTTWAFISEEDYNAYQAAKNLTKGDPMLNDREYKYAINAENAEYKQFRLVIDRLVANNNQINLAELTFTTNVDFLHYVGRVYDNMGEQPDNLKVGGSSGYATEYKTNADDPRLGGGVTIQRTHEYEHEIYLLPGATVDLTPFSDFGSTAWNAYNYREQYVRWFDYKTDLLSSRLTFDKRNGLNVNSLDEGHFAWNLNEDSNITKDEWRRSREGSLAHYTAVANPVSDANGVIDVIAIEAGGIFDWDVAVWDAGKNAYIAKEPTLLWRHTFVIKDAKRRSDEMFATAAANNTYIQNHKIKLMCPAGTPFQYPLPSFEDKEVNATHPTNFYYRTAVDTYEPVYHYSIETVKDGVRLGATNVNFKSVAPEGEGKEDQMAYSFKDIEGFNRVFYIENPQVGKYTISIHAMNTNCTGGARDDRMGQDTPLLLMQYELEVLPPADGIMVNEDDLNNTSALSHQIPANMDRAFGKPTTKVDFDEVLPSQTTPAGNGHSYLKWPWQWENSSYGFGYEKRGDYNMYMVADHMTVTPYHGRELGATDEAAFRDVYDRKYYDNGKDLNKKGYFFYANAASDPSRMSVLNIGKDFCTNTKVFVSAWINEFQGKNEYAETANVIFSFRGVKADGTETVLNSFVTGYISGGWNTPKGYLPKTITKDKEGKDSVIINHINAETNPDNRGKWMHVYYTFKTGQEAEGFDHYIITLENNCTSSEGADYAIDDIRCYVRKPKVDALQLKPVCNGDPTTDLKVYADFDQMMDVFAFNEENGTNNLYYCFLDREIYERELKKAYDTGIANGDINSTTYPTLTDWREKVDKTDASSLFRTSYETAFNAALIQNTYGSAHTDHGELTYNKRYTDNPEYSDVESFNSYYTALRQDLGTTRNLIFPCKANDSNMKVGKQYVIGLTNTYDAEKTLAVNFRLEDKCQSSNDFVVVFSGEIKVDGTLYSEQDGMSFCSNQRPNITIDLNGISENGSPEKTEQAYFDWYYGPIYLNREESEQGWTVAYHTEEKDGVSLAEAIGYFRDEYPTASQEDVMSDASTVVPSGSFTQEMLDYIQEMVSANKLSLYKKNEAISTTDIFSNTHLMETNQQKKYYLTAIPINPDPSSHVKYCLEPMKITIDLNARTPHMKDGDDQGLIPYPSNMRDVPLRIGLKQLKDAVIENLYATSASKKLLLPLRDVTPSTTGVTTLIQKPNDDLVYLAASNDPNVLDGSSGAIDITEYNETTGKEIVSDLKVIGKLLAITADKAKWHQKYDPAQESTNPGNICHLAFIRNFKFREGYWYTLKFHFEENYNGIPGDHSDVCPGDVVFTIKVVPEYQMWTGAVSRNWNDDGNWKRVTRAELLNPTEGNVPDEFVVGTSNNNTASFVPADFTKVIIPAGVQRIPYMYNMRENVNKTLVNFTGAPSQTYFINNTDADLSSKTGAKNTEIGFAADTINYDMASVVRRDGHIACRTWYDHTCDQIHFNAGAELMDQRYLYYNKAWCDIDVPVGTWQTVASPLMNIVAGDLYLPTTTARQETPLFEDIRYQPSLNDRFKPAVFQKSWNKGGKATVYKIDGNSANVGISLDWSHVYNDVNVEYGAGHGFAIKVDVSAMTGEKPANAKFRFPKADTRYTYYNPNNTDGDKKTEGVNNTDIDNGVRPGRLGDLSGTFQQQVGGDTQTATSYFLVGNPLMCWLDMEAFFNANTQFEKKYWIVGAQGQNTALFSEENGWVTTLTGDARYIAPCTSFFLKKSGDAATTTEPQFTAEMMSYAQGEQRNENNDYNARLRTRGNDGSVPQLCLTVQSASGRRSRAVIYAGKSSAVNTALTNDDCAPALFDSNLSSDAMIYTSRHGEALSIASIAPGDTLPIGIAQGNTGERLSLHIDGADGFDMPLYLIDSELGAVTPLNELAETQTADNRNGETQPAFCINDNCPSGVRYYITTSPASSSQMQMEVNMPRLTVHAGGFTIHAPANADITASDTYTASGILINHSDRISTSLTVPVSSGIYVVKLKMDGTDYEYKIRVR